MKQFILSALPKVPDSINGGLMSRQELYTKLMKGYEDAEAGKVTNAAGAFSQFGE